MDSQGGRPRGSSDFRPLPVAPEEHKDEGRREFTAEGRQPYYFDNDSVQKQLRLFGEISMPYFKEERSAQLLLGGVILLTLASSATSVWFSYIGRDFWTALSSKNEAQFYEMMIRFFGALVVGVPINVLYRYQRGKLSLSWREWLTNRLMELYYANQNYYRLEASKEIDNPDQRIAEDIKAFTKDSLEFFITALTAIIDLVAFSTILYKIYPQLFIAILAYAGVGTVVTTYVGKRLVGLNFLQLQREAFFRYSLVRVRENSESIAFYGGEEQELKEIRRRLTSLLDNFRDVINTQRNLEFFTVSYRYLIQVIPGLVVAPLFFAGKIELGVVSQSYSAFNHILSDLSLIVNQFESLSAFSAGIDRLGEFLEKIQGAYSRPGEGGPAKLSTLLSSDFLATVKEGQRQAAGHGLARSPNGEEEGVALLTAASPTRVTREGSPTREGQQYQSIAPAVGSRGVEVLVAPGKPLELEHVSVTTPDGSRLLVKDLSLRLPTGSRLLIVGNSGTGKSSLLRVMAGLWSSGSGRVTRPSTSEMFFLPQRPYCTLGTLRDQLTYPQRPGVRDRAATDEELVAIFEAVNLGELPRRFGNGSAILGLDASLDWAGTLSLGEQQRLAFGRLLYNKPSLAILDEATSALDLASEQKMYTLLQSVPGISYVSVGHRPSLLGFHDTKLTLSAEEGYAFTPITGEVVKAASGKAL